MKKLSFLLYFIISFEVVFTQISFNTIDVEDGLSQNSVVNIIQDSTGYLWFATQDGLNRYHGAFTVYDEKFKDITRDDFAHLGKLFVDRMGSIWIVTFDGVLKKYDANDDVFVPNDHFKNVVLFFQDSGSYYWIMTTFGHIIRSDSSLSIHDTIFNNTSYAFFDIEQIDSNSIAVASSNGVLKFETDKQYITNENTSLLGLSVSSLDHKWGRSIYTTFKNGVYSETDSDSIEKMDYSLLENAIFYEVLIDQKNRIWLGTYGSGLFLIDNGNVRQFLPNTYIKYGLAYHDVLDIYEDDSGVIWIGTDGGGVSYFDENLKKFQVKTNENVPSDINVDVIRAIYTDNEYVYLGTSGKGLTVYNKQDSSWEKFTTEDGLLSNRIMAINKAKNNNILLGSQFNGLSVIEFDQQFGIKNITDYLKGETIWSIENIDDENFWIATLNSGIILFNTKYGIVKSKIIRNANNETVNIRVIKILNDNRLLLGTEKSGIFFYDIQNDRYQKLNFSTYEIKKVKHINVGEHRIFVATNGDGLFILDKATFQIVNHIDVKSGLPNNVIYGVEAGCNGELWISSNRGISEIEILNDTNFHIRNYLRDEGLQSYEYNTGAHFKTDRGEIYFGGIKGFNWFDPCHLKYNNKAPKPYIEDIKVGCESIPLLTECIQLKPNENIFSFHMASNQLAAPNRNIYKYRLRDFQKEWQFTDNPDVLFMNIKPGFYTFEFSVANYDGIWSHTVASKKIHILQVWYLTWWFKVLFCTVIGYLVYRIWNSDRIRIKLQHKTKQQKLKQEYLESLSETRTLFFANITHELLTPLTVIKGLSNKIEGNTNIKNIILNNCICLIELVNQVLSISKLKGGQLKHEPYLLDVISFINYITDSFSSLANEKFIALNFYSEVPTIIMDFDPNKMRAILSNLIVNAIKYTPQYGKVMVTAKQECERLIVTVKDNGIGMDDKTLANVFNRFYQVNPSSQGGVGIGLSIVKEYCEIMNVDLSIESTLNQGSQFQLSFNITQNATPLKCGVVQEVLENANKIEADNNKSCERNILLVEDNGDVANYIIGVLSGKYTCIYFKNGKDAFHFAIENIPDLIITDIMMPIMNGVELSKNIRADIRTSHIPIIMLTAKVSEEDKIAGLKTGVNAYLTKPFNEDELLIRIENLFESRFAMQRKLNKNLQGAGEFENNSENIFLDKVKQVIIENLGNENLSINDICLAVNLERTQVYRKLKALIGKSASELIKDVRLEKALAILQNDDYQISEVAFKVGYKDVSYFSKSFKSKFGVSPSSFKSHISKSNLKTT